MDAPYIDLNAQEKYSNAIEQIIEHRKKPLLKLQEDKQLHKKQLDALREFRVQLELLGSFARELYGFESVFYRRLLIPKQSGYLEGIAQNRSPLKAYRLQIDRIASRHQVATQPFPKEQNFKEGTFVLEVNQQRSTYSFKGGKMTTLKSLFNQHRSKSIESEIVKQASGENVLVLTSQVEGRRGRIRLIDDKDNVLKHLGLYEVNPLYENKVIFRYPKVQTGGGSSTGSVVVGERTVTLGAGSRYSPKMNKPLTLTPQLPLRFRVSLWKDDVSKIPVTRLTPTERLRQLRQKIFPVKERLQLDELILDSQLMRPYNKPEAPSTNETNEAPSLPTSDRIAIIYYTEKGMKEVLKKSLYMKDVNETGDVNVNDYFTLRDEKAMEGFINGIEWVNESADKVYVFEKLTIGEPDTYGEDTDPYRPAQELTPAKNAIVDYQGLKVERPTNAFDDLIDGIRLQLQSASKEPVDFEVQLNEKSVDDAVVNFIAQYNICMEMLNVFLSRHSPDDNVDDKDKVLYGLFQREHSMRFLKDKFMRVMTSSHITSRGDALQLMVHIGAKNLFYLGDTGNINAGKIDFDEAIYRNALRRMPEHVGELFGYDKNGDGVVDEGVAYQVHRIQKGYTDRNAILDSHREIVQARLKELDQKIAREENQIEDYRKKLQ